MRIKLDLDPKLADALVNAAYRNIRHPHQESEAIIREKLGISPSTMEADPALSGKEVVANAP
jgi:hypothetical protein